MGFCTRRTFLLTICILQLISTIERQVFDFLGYMWAPILANFFHLIFVIFGFFGAFQYRPKYTITYSVWSALWIGWNIFIICFYLDVGILDKNSDVLNMGTGSVSWWEINGVGCKPIYATNLTAEGPDPFRPLRPERVTGCVLEYQYVEVLHATFQCILALLGGVGGIFVSHIFLEEDDSLQVNNYNKRKASNKKPLYSIEYSPHTDSCVVNEDNGFPFSSNGASHSAQLSPRPMTPRRVKRRSVISRGSTGRNSLTSHHHDKRNSLRHNNARSSLRASGRRNKIQHTNPVSRLIEQQQNLHHQHQHRQMFGDSSTSNESHRLNMYEPSSSQADLLVNNTSTPQWKIGAGHTNPMCQQSSTQSLPEDEDAYNNRPSSARSSYSNYHGTRPISCYMNPGGAPYIGPGQATGQVPVANTYRNAGHGASKTRANPGFLNNGPPAYQVQGGVDSETVI